MLINIYYDNISWGLIFWVWGMDKIIESAPKGQLNVANINHEAIVKKFPKQF